MTSTNLIKKVKKVINSDPDIRKFVEEYDVYQEIPTGILTSKAHLEFFDRHFKPALEKEYQEKLKQHNANSYEYDQVVTKAIENQYQAQIGKAQCQLLNGRISESLKKEYDREQNQAWIQEVQLRKETMRNKLNKIVNNKAQQIANNLQIPVQTVIEIFTQLGGQLSPL